MTRVGLQGTGGKAYCGSFSEPPQWCVSANGLNATRIMPNHRATANATGDGDGYDRIVGLNNLERHPSLPSPRALHPSNHHQHPSNKLYTQYLARLNPNSPFSISLLRNASLQANNNNNNARPPATEKDRQNIRRKYEQQSLEKRKLMFEKALLLAHEREKEIGRRFRSRKSVQFKVNYQTYYGQSIYLVGSVPSLGSWDIKKAVELSWGPGDNWVGDVVLSTDDDPIEYKYVAVDKSSNNALWEPGSNHSLSLASLRNSLVVDGWGSGGH